MSTDPTNIEKATRLTSRSTKRRSLRKRLDDEFVYVGDFGAVGDGVTNDTTAFQAALATGKTVYFGLGDYLISDTLIVGGAGGSLTQGLIGESAGGDGVTGSRLLMLTPGKPAVWVTAQQCRLENFSVWGKSPPDGTDAIGTVGVLVGLAQGPSCDKVRLANLHVRYFMKTGFLLSGCQNMTIYSCSSSFNKIAFDCINSTRNIYWIGSNCSDWPGWGGPTGQNNFTAGGTATAATSTTINIVEDVTAPPVGPYVGQVVKIIAGTGAEQGRRITAISGLHTLTVSPAWTITPNTTSVYRVAPLRPFVPVNWYATLGHRGVRIGQPLGFYTEGAGNECPMGVLDVGLGSPDPDLDPPEGGYKVNTAPSQLSFISCIFERYWEHDYIIEIGEGNGHFDFYSVEITYAKTALLRVHAFDVGEFGLDGTRLRQVSVILPNLNLINNTAAPPLYGPPFPTNIMVDNAADIPVYLSGIDGAFAARGSVIYLDNQQKEMLFHPPTFDGTIFPWKNLPTGDPPVANADAVHIEKTDQQPSSLEVNYIGGGQAGVRGQPYYNILPNPVESTISRYSFKGMVARIQLVPTRLAHGGGSTATTGGLFVVAMETGFTPDDLSVDRGPPFVNEIYTITAADLGKLIDITVPLNDTYTGGLRISSAPGITIHGGTGSLDTGLLTLAAGGTSTVTLNVAIGTADPTGCRIRTIGGTGTGQTSYIDRYNPATRVATLVPPFGVATNTTTQYVIDLTGRFSRISMRLEEGIKKGQAVTTWNGTGPLPFGSNWELGDLLTRNNSPLVGGQVLIDICSQAGTAGALKKVVPTLDILGTTVAGSNVILVDEMNRMQVGQYIKLAGEYGTVTANGATGAVKIVSITRDKANLTWPQARLTVNAIATAGVTGAIVSYSNPAFVTQPTGTKYRITRGMTASGNITSADWGGSVSLSSATAQTLTIVSTGMTSADVGSWFDIINIGSGTGDWTVVDNGTDGINRSTVHSFVLPVNKATRITLRNATTPPFFAAETTGLTGTGVTDGDKGDITVSASGATWTIDPAAVTYSKIQNVTTARVLGRVTAGSGVAEELTAAQVNTFLGNVPLADGDKTDITVSSSGTVWTIDSGAVTYPKIQNVSATARVLGRKTVGAGVVEELTGTDLATILGSAGVSDGDKTDITVSSSGSVWTIDPQAVTYSKIQNVSATSRVLGRVTAGAGTIEELTGAQLATLTGLVGVTTGDKGDITVSAAGATWTVDNSAITYAKIQNVSATSRVLGRKAAGAGVVEELTGTDLQTIIGSTGVTDGDKGDITVSSTGAVWTVDPAAITYAKIQNVSATSRVLGRKTAGAGVVEELTSADLTSLLGLTFLAAPSDADFFLQRNSGNTDWETAREFFSIPIDIDAVVRLYRLNAYAHRPGVITGAIFWTLTSGMTATVTVRIGATAVTGLSALSLTSTKPGSLTSATAANSFADGNEINFDVTAVASTPTILGSVIGYYKRA